MYLKCNVCNDTSIKKKILDEKKIGVFINFNTVMVENKTV